MRVGGVEAGVLQPAGRIDVPLLADELQQHLVARAPVEAIGLVRDFAGQFGVAGLAAGRVVDDAPGLEAVVALVGAQHAVPVDQDPDALLERVGVEALVAAGGLEPDQSPDAFGLVQSLARAGFEVGRVLIHGGRFRHRPGLAGADARGRLRLGGPGFVLMTKAAIPMQSADAMKRTRFMAHSSTCFDFSFRSDVDSSSFDARPVLLPSSTWLVLERNALCTHHIPARSRGAAKPEYSQRKAFNSSAGSRSSLWPLATHLRTPFRRCRRVRCRRPRVPQRDERQLLAMQRHRVEEHPYAGALPYVVARSAAQPFRQFLARSIMIRAEQSRAQSL